MFPSIYEGYGLPPAKAMACGCPVLAAQAASIPEVCGDAALYFDPPDPAELAAQLTRVMSEKALREDLCAKGRLCTASMHWHDAALALVNEIRRVRQ
jgi:glycosyltransferase involved in cell wall biosynthesis